MTAFERDQLLQFLATLRQQRRVPKDALADGLIRETLGQQPDVIYGLVQRGLALQLALDAAQLHLAELQAQCNTHAAQGQGLTIGATPATPEAIRSAAAGVAAVDGAPVQAASMAQVQPSPWGRGLLATIGGTALGMTTGVVAGGLMLQGLQGLHDLTESEAGEGLWGLGDDGL